jgi:hypothetical protein
MTQNPFVSPQPLGSLAYGSVSGFEITDIVTLSQEVAHAANVLR